MTLRPSMGCSCCAMPMKVNTSVVASAGTWRVYWPSRLVTVPMVVPFTITDAPGIGSPSSPVTVPVSEVFCAFSPVQKAITNDMINKSFRIKK